MSLIEQLGGYEFANSKLLKMDKILKEVYYSHSDAQKANELRQALLEHRRQHNIFEKGDKVVYLILGNDVIIYDDWLKTQNSNWIRHATQEEIKVGHRL